MCQEAIRRLCNPSERCHVRKVVRLLARPLSKPDFVFMFATVGYDQRSLLQAMRVATGSAPLSDCSAEAPSAATTQTNRTSPWSSWLFLLRSCGGPTA